MSFGNNNKQFFANMLIWMAISLGISLTISILLPFPISLVAIIGVFILLNFYMRRRMMQRMGIGRRGTGPTGIFGSSLNEGSIINYYCMGCGTKHNEAACPKCGSKMKKVG